MLKVFRFLLLLRSQKYWGEIRIKMKDGEVVGQIKAEQEFIMDTLPQPVPGTTAAAQIAHYEVEHPEVFGAAARKVAS